MSLSRKIGVVAGSVTLAAASLTAAAAIALSTPAGGCSSWPAASDVGPSGTMTPYTGATTITADGTILDSVAVNGTLVVDANNVTIRNSRVLGKTGASYVVEQMSGNSGLTIVNSEVGPQSGQHPDRAIASFGTDLVVDHSIVHGTQRGIQTGDYTTVECSYADDFDNSSGNHATAVMSLGGTNHVKLLNNTFGCGTGQCSAAMSVYPQVDYGGANDDWTITGNLFNGGSYCVYLGYTPADGESPNTNIQMLANQFGVKYGANCGSYGPIGSWFAGAGTGNVWSGNTWYAPGLAKDGTAINQPSDPTLVAPTTTATVTPTTAGASTTTTVPSTTSTPTTAPRTTTTAPPTTNPPTTTTLPTVVVQCPPNVHCVVVPG